MIVPSHGTYLLLPALELFDKEIVSLGDFAKLGIHTTLEVDEVLPCLESVSGVLISFPNNFIQVSHRDLSHKRLLHSPSKHGFHPRVPSLL